MALMVVEYNIAFCLTFPYVWYFADFALSYKLLMLNDSVICGTSNS